MDLIIYNTKQRNRLNPTNRIFCRFLVVEKLMPDHIPTTMMACQCLFPGGKVGNAHVFEGWERSLYGVRCLTLHFNYYRYEPTKKYSFFITDTH